MVFKFGKDNNARDIVRRSHPAVCGLTEREVVVKDENVIEVKRKLRDAGFYIVGTSENGGKTKKIWFSRTVGL